MKPSQEYTIKILSPEDYDKLPYDGAEDSLGMSVMETKTAYIRSTGVKEMDQGTINHEFDELMQATSPHEINGIRYKGFTDFLKALLPVFIGPGPASALAAVTNNFGVKQTDVLGFGQQQTGASPAPFTPSPATSAFAPQAQQPLGRAEFDKSLAGLASNRAATEKSVLERFRGLRPQGAAGSSAFQSALGRANTSADLTRSTFLEDQRKLGSTFA